MDVLINLVKYKCYPMCFCEYFKTTNDILLNVTIQLVKESFNRNDSSFLTAIGQNICHVIKMFAFLLCSDISQMDMKSRKDLPILFLKHMFNYFFVKTQTTQH